MFSLPGIHLRSSVSEALETAGVSEEGVAEKMCRYMMAARSDSTVCKYYNSFKRWQQFCNQNNFCDLPAGSIHVAVFLTKLLDTGSTHHVILAAVYGIKWAHEINGLDDPTNNAFVRNLHEAAKRTTGHKTVKKDVVTADMIIDLCNNFVNSNDVIVIRDLCMITTAFAGFLRYDELSSIRCKDLNIQPDYFVISIQKSKTDQYRTGDEVSIAKGSSSACPYNMLLRFMSVAGVTSDSNHFLFKPANRTKNVCKLITKDKKLSYSRARECILKMLGSVAPNGNFGVHSLRSGGATTAAKKEVVTVVSGRMADGGENRVKMGMLKTLLKKGYK